MKPFWSVSILVFLLAQAALAFSPCWDWRWRADDGDIYRATWKDSVKCSITYQGEGNIRLRKSIVFQAGTMAITLRYNVDPKASLDDSLQWTLVTPSDTGMFFLSDSRFLDDGARDSNNVMLNTWGGTSAAVCRGTITIDSSSQYLCSGNWNEGYEFEYCLKPNLAKIPESSVFYFRSFMNGAGESGFDPPSVRFPPLYWNYSKKSEHIRIIQFIDELRGWYQGYNGVNDDLWRTMDGGRTWTKVADELFSCPMFFVTGDTGWAVVKGRLSRSTDAGATWTPRDSGMQMSRYTPSSIFFLDTRHGWVTRYDDPIMKTSNGGATWEPVKTPWEYWESVYFLSDLVGFAVGENLYKTTDGGASWRLVLSPSGPSHKDGEALREQAAQGYGRKHILDADNGGQIQFINSNEGWVRLYHGSVIFHTTDGGELWTVLENFGVADLEVFHFSEEGKAWVVGPGGMILATKDGGKKWERRPSGTRHDLKVVTGVKDHVWIGCEDGTILSSESGGWLTTIDVKRASVPEAYVLYQNYPNPFNPSTTIRYALPRSAHVRLRIYDMLGREVATIVDEVKPPGTHEATWNASRYSSGIYFCRISAGGFVQTRMMAIVK